MIRKITTKSSLIALLCLVSSGVANAQITLQATNIPSVGDQWVNKIITDTTIQAGSGGAGAIWDFTAYFITVNTIAEEFKAVTGSGDDVNFPTANMKVVHLWAGQTTSKRVQLVRNCNGSVLKEVMNYILPVFRIFSPCRLPITLLF
ncbi:MAG: hypothetical protein U0X76_10595 [Bacteroidia bacterium]